MSWNPDFKKGGKTFTSENVEHQRVNGSTRFKCHKIDKNKAL